MAVSMATDQQIEKNNILTFHTLISIWRQYPIASIVTARRRLKPMSVFLTLWKMNTTSTL